jgi:DNA-binding MarR family transcriptional regulator
MEVLAELVPPEDLVSYTRITPQALYYAENRSFKHKLMVSGEDEGLLGSDYAMRELISSKRISLAAPVKDTATGKMKTVEYEVEGPIALLFSTTQPAIHYENATRCFLLSLDESKEQTQRIMSFQRQRKTIEGVMRSLEGRALRRVHRNAQRLLKPLLVVNPFADGLKFAAHRIESRREYEKYLSLIEAIAFLKQCQREIKRLPSEGRELEYIEVTKADIAEADKLMGEAVGDQGDELSRPSRQLLELIQQMAEKQARELEIDPRAFQFNRRDIREYTGWSDNQIKAHIKRLEELEYLAVKTGERGRMYRYQLGSWAPVGQKLGEQKNGRLDEEGGTSWEVGQVPGKGHMGRNKELVGQNA